jgi:hypothetical protein
MSFIKKLFGGGKSNRFIPSRPLKLLHEVTPENAARFANQFVEIINTNEKVGLNYSVGTLAFVDQFLERFKRQNVTVDKFAETIFVAGCYVGQTMLLNGGGKWIANPEINVQDGVRRQPLLLQLANGTIVDPITKAFRRFEKGESDSLMKFYQASA